MPWAMATLWCGIRISLNLGGVYCSGNRTQYAADIVPVEKLRKYLEKKKKKKSIRNDEIQTRDHRVHSRENYL